MSGGSHFHSVRRLQKRKGRPRQAQKHEMAHLVERNHGERFAKLMDSLLPDWRARRDALNDAPLADEVWVLPTRPAS